MHVVMEGTVAHQHTHIHHKDTYSWLLCSVQACKNLEIKKHDGNKPEISTDNTALK